VVSYDIRPGNGKGLFWFQRFINLSLTYLLRHLPTDLQPGTHTERVSVCLYACLYVLGTLVSCAKTAEPIEMPFGGWLMWLQGTMY